MTCSGGQQGLIPLLIWRRSGYFWLRPESWRPWCRRPSPSPCRRTPGSSADTWTRRRRRRRTRPPSPATRWSKQSYTLSSDALLKVQPWDKTWSDLHYSSIVLMHDWAKKVSDLAEESLVRKLRLLVWKNSYFSQNGLKHIDHNGQYDKKSTRSIFFKHIQRVLITCHTNWIQMRLV